MANPRHVSKFLVALATALAVAVSEGLVPAEYESYVTVALAALGSFGVYAARNKPNGIKVRTARTAGGATITRQ